MYFMNGYKNHKDGYRLLGQKHDDHHRSEQLEPYYSRSSERELKRHHRSRSRKRHNYRRSHRSDCSERKYRRRSRKCCCGCCSCCHRSKLRDKYNRSSSSSYKSSDTDYHVKYVKSSDRYDREQRKNCRFEVRDSHPRTVSEHERLQAHLYEMRIQSQDAWQKSTLQPPNPPTNEYPQYCPQIHPNFADYAASWNHNTTGMNSNLRPVPPHETSENCKYECETLPSPSSIAETLPSPSSIAETLPSPSSIAETLPSPSSIAETLPSPSSIADGLQNDNEPVTIPENTNFDDVPRNENHTTHNEDELGTIDSDFLKELIAICEGDSEGLNKDDQTLLNNNRQRVQYLNKTTGLEENLFIAGQDTGVPNMKHLIKGCYVQLQRLQVAPTFSKEKENKQSKLEKKSSVVKNNNPNWHCLNRNKICRICDGSINSSLVNHYVNAHPKSEVICCRVTPDIGDHLRSLKFAPKCEITKKSRKGIRSYKQICYFCNEMRCFVKSRWIDHLITHTGYYKYQCTICSMKFSRNLIHVCENKNKIKRLAQPQFEGVEIIAYLCDLCNFVRFDETEIEDHLEFQHEGNVSDEFTEIVFLSFSDKSQNVKDEKVIKKQHEAANLQKTKMNRVENSDDLMDIEEKEPVEQLSTTIN